MRSSFPLVCGLLVSAAAGCAASAPPPQPPQGPAPAAPAEPTPDAPLPADGAAGSDGGGSMCGGIAGVQCAAGQYCRYQPEAHCGAADMSGVCATVPDVCSQQLDEVCGCDDKTYGNACMAAQAGVSVIAPGPCKPPQ